MHQADIYTIGLYLDYTNQTKLKDLHKLLAMKYTNYIVRANSNYKNNFKKDFFKLQIIKK